MVNQTSRCRHKTKRVVQRFDAPNKLRCTECGRTLGDAIDRTGEFGKPYQAIDELLVTIDESLENNEMVMKAYGHQGFPSV